MGLISAFSPGPRALIALVGGGGKTTLLRTLAEKFSETGRKVVATTTTKVSRGEALGSPSLVWCDSDQEACVHAVREALRKPGWVFVGRRPVRPDKVEGIAPDTVTAFFQEPDIDYVIVEADGASGRPVKVPADHEPIIPDAATLTVALMGLEAVGKPFGPDIAFRTERITELTGLRTGDPLRIDVLAKLFAAQGLFRGTPAGTRRMVFLNKTDLMAEGDAAIHLARSILETSDADIERVVIGSLLQDTYSTIERGRCRASTIN